MADSAVAVTAGTGTNIDTRTEATNGNHRQVMVIGDPSTNAGVAPVDATNGLAVDNKAWGGTAVDTNSGSKSAGTLRVVLATDQPALTNKLLVTPDLPSGASTAANQTTLIGHVDGIEALLTTIDSDTSALAGAVAGNEMQVDIVSSALPTGAATAAKQPALGTAGTASTDVQTFQGISGMVPVVTVGKTVVKTGTITRPADTTAYAAGDAFTNSTSVPATASISGCARANGGSGVIIGATLMSSANQSTKLDCDIFIFDTTITADNDNSAFTPTDTELATAVGVITFSGANAKTGDATSGASGNCIYPSSLPNPMPFVCGGGSDSLFWSAVPRNGYTPVSGEVLTLRLTISQD